MRVAITVKCVSLRVDVLNAAPILRVNHAAMHANALMTARTFNIRLVSNSIHRYYFIVFSNCSDQYLVISNRDNRGNRTDPLENFFSIDSLS